MLRNYGARRLQGSRPIGGEITIRHSMMSSVRLPAGKRTLLVGTAAVGAALLLVRAAHADAAPLTFEDAVRFALSRNERARISDLNVVGAEASLEHARTAFLPTLTLSGNDTFRPNPAERNGVPTQTRNSATGTATLNQPLVNASAWPLYSQSKALLEGQRAQTIDDKRVLAFDAAHAFFAVLNAEAVLTAAQRRADSAGANLADTQARAQAQLTSSNDVTRAQIDVNDASRELELDHGNLENALVQLSFVINATVNGEVGRPENLLRAAEQTLPSAQQLGQLALSKRPDVLSKRYSADAAHDFADEPLLRLVPTVSLTGQAQALTNPPATGRWIDETLGATATWTIYDAGARYADKHLRDAHASIADLNVRALVRTVDVAGARARRPCSRAQQAAFQQAERGAVAARKSADETAILYKQGLAKAIELVDANDSRFLAEVNDASAEYSMAEAYLNLRQALGLDPLGTEYR